MRRPMTEQERIDDQTMRINNPKIVGSGYIQFEPQRPFQQPLLLQPPTVAHLEFPEEYKNMSAANQRAAAAGQPLPHPNLRQPPPAQPQYGGGRGPAPSGYAPQAGQYSQRPPQAGYGAPRAAGPPQGQYGGRPQSAAPQGRPQSGAPRPQAAPVYAPHANGRAAPAAGPPGSPKRAPTQLAPGGPPQQQPAPRPAPVPAPQPAAQAPKTLAPATALAAQMGRQLAMNDSSTDAGTDDGKGGGMSKSQKKRMRKKLRDGAAA